MKIINTIAEMKEIVKEAKKLGQRIGLVPTMGFLHQGHLNLMERARENCELLVTTIFVNPLQFGAGEDYDDYPRDLTRDAELARGVGVDIIFAPSVKEMYPQGYYTFVNTDTITEVMCGASRPGHFKGVTTVVNKLFNITQPDEAYFGQKDAQQVIVIEKMVTDLNMPINIVRVPIVREEDGLAMSSRNVYLSSEEREQAVILYQSLCKARELIAGGLTMKDKLYHAIKENIEEASLAKIDYIEIRDAQSLMPQEEKLTGKVLIALAVRFGKTRLIDNIIVEVVNDV
ncbi:MAG: pantoate--beta-alanine ligase [Bacillota bacterium]|nr:pantoate--beta-alanine ligase [Bacillota bacterium]